VTETTTFNGNCGNYGRRAQGVKMQEGGALALIFKELEV